MYVYTYDIEKVPIIPVGLRNYCFKSKINVTSILSHAFAASVEMTSCVFPPLVY